MTPLTQLLLLQARSKAQLSLRELASLAGTSHSTLSSYERGTKTPSVETFLRIIRAAGFELDAELRPRHRFDGSTSKGIELAEVLALAEAFPARHSPNIEMPPFGRAS